MQKETLVMRKFFLLVLAAGVCAISLNCGGGGATNVAVNTGNSSANKTPAPASTTPASNTNAGSTASNADLDFTLVNKTGYAIKKVYIGPAANTDWAEDDEILKGRAFADGATMEVKFHPKATAANWDLRVEWADGSPADEWLKLNLTKIDKVTLHYDRASDKTTADIE
jgi:hypothetical protein